MASHAVADIENPLVMVVGEAALKVRLDLNGAAGDMPGAVRGLGQEQEPDAFAKRGISGRHTCFLKAIRACRCPAAPAIAVMFCVCQATQPPSRAKFTDGLASRRLDRPIRLISQVLIMKTR